MNLLFTWMLFAGDTALWLSWGGLVLSVFTPVTDSLFLIPVMGFAGLLADWLGSKRKILSWAALLPVFSMLPLCHGKGDVLLLLPLIGYLGMCIRQGTIQPNPSELYYRFSMRTGILLAGCVFSILGGKLWCFQCAVFSLVMSVFLLRMLRHSQADFRSPRLLVLELALMAVVLSFCLMLSSQGALSAAAAVLQMAFFLLIEPLLRLALYLLVAVLSVIFAIFESLFRGEQAIPFPEQLPMVMENADAMLLQEEGTANPLVLLIIKAIGALIFLAAAWFLFRYLQAAAGKRLSIPKEEKNVVTQIPETSERPILGILDRSPEARIRRSYAAYCRALNRRGHKIRRSDTSRSINALAGFQHIPEAAELRQLYLLARYTSSSALTQEDARRAAALSRALRGRLEE